MENLNENKLEEISGGIVPPPQPGPKGGDANPLFDVLRILSLLKDEISSMNHDEFEAFCTDNKITNIALKKGILNLAGRQDLVKYYL